MNEDTPENSLPVYADCMILMRNEESLTEKGAVVDGLLKDDFYYDTPRPNELHRFIYEYDCNDPFKSAWFLHRLEKVIDFVRSDEYEEFLKHRKINKR